MRSIQSYLLKKLPGESIQNSYSAQLLSDNNASQFQVTITTTQNFYIIDQRFSQPNIFVQLSRISVVIYLTSSIVMLYLLYIVINDFFNALLSVLILVFFIVFISISRNLLSTHDINIKIYPKEWVTVQEKDNDITLTINSKRKLSKEINNYYYVIKQKPNTHILSLDNPQNLIKNNLYHFLNMEKSTDGTVIIYKLAKLPEQPPANL